MSCGKLGWADTWRSKFFWRFVRSRSVANMEVCFRHESLGESRIVIFSMRPAAGAGEFGRSNGSLLDADFLKGPEAGRPPHSVILDAVDDEVCTRRRYEAGWRRDKGLRVGGCSPWSRR